MEEARNRRELPATDRVMVDTIQATAKMTGLEEKMMFHIDPGTPQDGDQNYKRWQKRPACNWDIGIWSSSPLPASHLTKIKDLHNRADTHVSRGAMIPEPESNGISRSQHRQKKLPGLLVYRNGDFATSPTNPPILDWIIAKIPQAVNSGQFMT